jgi:hypothetical protein
MGLLVASDEIDCLTNGTFKGKKRVDNIDITKKL